MKNGNGFVGEQSVAVRVNVFEPGTMFLRMDVGSAGDKTTGQEWEMSTNIADNAPIIRLPDGRWITFPWTSLIEAANAVTVGTP